MYNSVLQIFLFASLGTIVYLLARVIPRVPEGNGITHTKDWFDRALNRLPLHQIDSWLNIRLERFLRRTKILTLKFDNVITHYLKRLRTAGKRTLGQPGNGDLFKDSGDGTKE